MKRAVLFSFAAVAILAQAASAQSLVLPVGKNATNAQSPSNPQCHELDINGIPYSATNPIPTQASQGGAAVGATNPLSVGISNGTVNLSGAAATAANALPVSMGNGTINTYSASTAFQTPVATPTDIVGLIGSATKTVKIQKIILHNTQTTAGINKIFLVKRSTADTGSTIVNPTPVAFSSGNAAVTAVLNQYTTTNPTTGSTTNGGTLATIMAQAPAPGAVSGGGDVVLFDAKVTGQPIILSGVAQELDLNFAGAAVPSGWTVSVDFQWSEE